MKKEKLINSFCCKIQIKYRRI